jgi:hypothetical protein
MIIDNARLARAARLLRWVALLGIALVLAAMALGSWSLLTGRDFSGAMRFDVDTGGLDPGPAALVLIIAGTLVVLALVQIAFMVRAVEQGAPFRTAVRLRRFALYLFLSLLAASLLPPLLQWAASLGGTPRRVSLSLNSEQLLMLFVTGLLFFVARLLEAAQSVAEDHQQIV